MVDRYKISGYTFDGLKGRKLYVASANPKSKTTFLIIYGQHISLERMRPIVDFVAQFGEVHLFDNPGFGNMEPSYKIHQKPTLDFYDQHLKNIFDNHLDPSRKIRVVGISFGFLLLTHFLQSYPEYQTRVDYIISFVGFMKYTNIHIPREMHILFKYILAGFGQTWPGYLLTRYIFFQPAFIVPFNFLISPINAKIKNASFNVKLKYANQQAWLWKYNDPRTHAYTAWQLVTKSDVTTRPIDLVCHHIYVENDQYMDNTDILKDMKKVFKDVKGYKLDIPAHSPLDLEDEMNIDVHLYDEAINIFSNPT